MIWVLLILAFMIIEGMTLNLVTIWFALGSLCAFITSFITDNIGIQIVVFLVVTTISLLVTKPFVKRFMKNEDKEINYDRIIGKTGLVIKKISKYENGRVKVDGKTWMAKSENEIEEGKEVEILKINGVKLIVKERER